MSRKSNLDLRLRRRDLAPGTVHYQVLATDRPTSRPVLIGCLRFTCEFVTSHYGDEKNYFQHDPGPIISVIFHSLAEVVDYTPPKTRRVVLMDSTEAWGC